jgi:diaminopimelate epimerase
VNFKGVEAVCSLEMPGPEKIESRRLALNGRDYAVTVVSMAGITHIIIDALEISGDKTIFAERALWEWKNIFKAEALGLILYDRVRNHIRPLIHVASTGSQVWERGCASGTAALGAALAHQAQGSTAADIAQPGGVISVLATYEAGQIVKTVISGQVKVVARGVAYL